MSQKSGASISTPKRQVGVAPVSESTGLPQPGSRAGLPVWDSWFHAATGDQQLQLLEQAQKHGVLSANELPAPRNGEHRNGDAHHAASSRLPLLRGLLSGRVSKLEPILATPIRPRDQRLSHVEQEAVARVLSTPDICLLESAEQEQSVRIVVEMLCQSAERGQRVLLVARDGRLLDRILEELPAFDELFPLRFPFEGEVIAPSVQRHVHHERLRLIRSQALAGSRQNLQAAEERCRTNAQLEKTWGRLAEILQQKQHDIATIAKTRESLASLTETIERDLGPRIMELNAGHRESLDRRAQARAQLQERLNELTATNEHETLLNELRPLVDAKRAGRIWKPAFWQALLQGDVAARHDLLEAQVRDLQEKRAAAQDALRQHDEEIAKFETGHAESLAALKSETTERARQSLTETLNDSESRLAEFEAEWAALTTPLGNPVEQSFAGIEKSQSEWRARREADEQQCRFARQWTQFVETSGDLVAKQLPALANILTGALSAWKLDRSFRQSVQAKPIDLLILLDAEQIAEPDLLDLAGHAERWALLHQPVAATHSLHRLHQALGAEAFVNSVCWSNEDRLSCRLHAPCEHPLERETLADSPDIELAFLNIPGQEPLLAEVTFPFDVNFEQAAQFVYREVGEFPGGWSNSDAWLSLGDGTISLGDAHCEGTTPLELEPGLRIHTRKGEVRRIEFEADRWDRPRIFNWLARHRLPCDSGRRLRLASA